jgi:hypothetical protein
MECKLKTHFLVPKIKRVVGNFEMGLGQTQKFEFKVKSICTKLKK